MFVVLFWSTAHTAHQNIKSTVITSPFVRKVNSIRHGTKEISCADAWSKKVSDCMYI